MTKVSIHEKLFALYRVSSEHLTDFFKGGNFDEYAIRANDFDVFCAFWVTACYLRSISKPHEREVEDFNRSIVVSIVDRIIASRPQKGLEEEQIDSLSQTITNVFVDRFSSYREFFKSDLKQRETDSVRLFPRLVEGFLGNVLDKPVPEHSPIRQLLDSTLEDMLNKSAIFLSADL
ncbi:MAG: hypothetical protein KKA54_06195 [Proteobacteria bacterium]|nr:hypothetical protein [Pseudomonadota bacterium]MBU0965955.1 hypothetical protein [Pseudomonadota bacterium]